MTIQEQANKLVDGLLECSTCGCGNPLCKHGGSHPLASIAAPHTRNLRRRLARGAGHTPPVAELNDLDQSLPHVKPS